jgi:hypothetical protein
MFSFAEALLSSTQQGSHPTVGIRLCLGPSSRGMWTDFMQSVLAICEVETERPGQAATDAPAAGD